MVSRRFIPPDRVSTLVSALSTSCAKSSSSVGPAPALRFPDPEVPPVDNQVLPHGEFLVEIVLLRHDAEPAADLHAIQFRVQAEYRQLSAGPGRHAGDHPHGG